MRASKTMKTPLHKLVAHVLVTSNCLIWAAVVLMCHIRMVDAQTSTQLEYAYDNQGSYVVNPTGSSTATNNIPRPYPVCSTVDATRYLTSPPVSTLDHLLVANSTNIDIQCLSVAVVPGYNTIATCLQGASITTSIVVQNATGTSSDVLTPNGIDTLFNGSIESSRIVAPYPIKVMIRVAITSMQCSAIDVLIMSTVTTQASSLISDVPTLSNLASTARAWGVNTSSNSPIISSTTATVFVRRLVGQPSLVSPQRFKFVLVPWYVSCTAADVINATYTDSPTTYTAVSSTSINNLALRADVAIPQTPGRYSLCVGHESSNNNNVTTTTALISIGTFRVVDIASPVYTVTPLEWQSPDVPPANLPSQPWSIAFDGLGGAFNVTENTAAVIVGSDADQANRCSNVSAHWAQSNSSNPLSLTATGRVVWTLASTSALPVSTLVVFCFRTSSTSVWREIPSYYGMDAYMSSTVLGPYVVQSPTQAPTTTTTVPPTTTTTTAPAPTLSGGCVTATTADLARFSQSTALFLRLGNARTNDVVSSIARRVSLDLCIDMNRLDLLQVRISGSVYLQIIISDEEGSASHDVNAPTNTSVGSGFERMAAFMYEVYPVRSGQYFQSYAITAAASGVAIVIATPAPSNSSMDQLFIGLGIAGVVCLLVCVCVLCYVCIRRCRRRRVHQRDDTNNVVHVPPGMVAVIPRQAAIAARARVVTGRRVPNEDGHVSDDDTQSFSSVGTAVGEVMDAPINGHRGGDDGEDGEEMKTVLTVEAFEKLRRADMYTYSNVNRDMIPHVFPAGTKNMALSDESPVYDGGSPDCSPSHGNVHGGSFAVTISTDAPMPPSRRLSASQSSLTHKKPTSAHSPEPSTERSGGGGQRAILSIVVGTPPVRSLTRDSDDDDDKPADS